MGQQNDKNLQGLYNTLKREGYNPPDYSKFVEDMKDDQNLQRARGTLLRHGYTPPDFDEFKADMFGETAAPASTAASPAKGALEPTEEEKIRMSYALNKSVRDFNARVGNTLGNVRRLQESTTQKGRDKLKGRRFGAQLAGVPTNVMGLTPPLPQPVKKSKEKEEYHAPMEQSPVPYGVKLVGGKPVTEWMLPDGSLTTSLVEADQTELLARKGRLRHQFELRMKENGLDPRKKNDVTRQAILDNMEINRRKMRAKGAEIAEDASEDLSWHDDESFFGNIGRLARNAIMRQENVQAGATLAEDADTDLHNLKAENYMLGKALSRLDAGELKKSDGILGGMFDVRNNLKNFAAGAAETLSNPDFYIGGMAKYAMVRQLKAIDNKVRNGAELTESDLNLVYATLLNMKAEQSGTVPHMYSAARTTVEMFPFMLQMATNPASGLSKALVRQFGRSALKRLGRDVIAKNAKKIAAGKIAATVIGDVAESAVLANTTQAPKTISDAMQRYVGDPVFDEDGKLKGFDGSHNALESIAKAEGAAVIENYTEMLGDHLGGLAGFLGKAVSKGAGKIGMGHVVDNTTTLIGRVKASEWGKAVGEIEKRAHWNGTLGEIAEEEAGIVLNSLFVGDNKMSDLVDADQQIDIALGVGLFGGFVSGIKTGGYLIGKRRASRKLSNANNVGSSRFGGRWAQIQSEIDNADEADIASVVRMLVQAEAKSQEQAKAISDYALSLMRARGYNLAKAKRNAEVGHGSPQQAAEVIAQNDADNSYDNGRGTYARYEEGDPSGKADVDETIVRMQDAYKYVEDAFGAESEYYKYQLEQEPWQLLTDYYDLTADQRDAVLYYINAKAALDGVKDAAEESVERKRAEVEQSVDRRTHKDRGMIIPATLKVDDRQVYVVKGDVAMCPDGSAVDERNSTESIVVMDALTGEYEFVTGSQILKVADPIDPRQEMETALAAVDKEHEDLLGDITEAGGQKQESGQPQPAEGISVGVISDKESFERGVEDGASSGYSGEALDKEIEKISKGDLSRLTDYERGWLEGLKEKQRRHYVANLRQNGLNLFGEADKSNLDSTPNTVATQPAEPTATQPDETGQESAGKSATPEETVIREGISGTADGLREAFTAERERIGNEWLANQGVQDAMRAYAEGASTVEEIVERAKADSNDERTRQRLDTLLEFDSTRRKLQSMLTVPKTGETVPESTGNAVSGGGIPSEAASSVENGQQTPLQRIPRNDKGKPVFEQAESPEVGWDALVEHHKGDAARAKVTAELMVENKRKALDKAKKQKPKGNDPDEILASQEANDAQLAQAEQEYDFWRQMASVEQRRQDALRAQQEAEAQLQAAQQTGSEKGVEPAGEAEVRTGQLSLDDMPEWHLDNPESARKRGARRYQGQMYVRQPRMDIEKAKLQDDEAVSAGFVVGKPVEVKFSQKNIIPGHYALIETDTMQPSHIQGQRNPMYFMDESQPKDRTDAVSVNSEQKIAVGIRPQEITMGATAYTGAPVIIPTRENVQGNNRGGALIYLWGNNLPEQQEKYRNYLLDNADAFGLKKEAILAMRKPSLVRVVDVDDAEAIRLGQMTAQDTESGGIERIKPKNVAQKLGADMRSFANQLLMGGDEDTTFGQLVDSNGVDVLKWMVQKKVISDTQYQSAFDTKGNMTPEAKNDLQKVLYQAAFKGGSSQLEEMFSRLPARVQRAVLQTSFRDMDSPESGKMLPEIQASVAAFDQLMQDKGFAKAKNMEQILAAVEDFKRQRLLDDRLEPYSPADNFSNFALHLAALYKSAANTQKSLAALFNRMFDMAQGTRERGLFDDDEDNGPLTLGEIVKKEFGFDYIPAKNGNRNDRTGGSSLDSGEKPGERGEQGDGGIPSGGEQYTAGAEPSDRGGGTDGVGSDPEAGITPAAPAGAQGTVGTDKEDTGDQQGTRGGGRGGREDVEPGACPGVTTTTMTPG